MKYIIIITLILPLVACTKDTYVEGLVPIARSFELNQSYTMSNNQSVVCKLNIDGNPFGIGFAITRYKSTSNNSYYGTGTGDSVLYVTVSSTVSIESRNGTVYRYNKGEQMNPTPTYGGSGTPLFEGIKKAPYTGGFVTVSNIGSYKLNFGTSQDGYLSFKLVTNNFPVYGWLHIIITDNALVFDRYGYQTFDAGKAGEE